MDSPKNIMGLNLGFLLIKSLPKVKLNFPSWKKLTFFPINDVAWNGQFDWTKISWYKLVYWWYVQWYEKLHRKLWFIHHQALQAQASVSAYPIERGGFSRFLVEFLVLSSSSPSEVWYVHRILFSKNSRLDSLLSKVLPIWLIRDGGF